MHLDPKTECEMIIKRHKIIFEKKILDYLLLSPEELRERLDWKDARISSELKKANHEDTRFILKNVMNRSVHKEIKSLFDELNKELECVFEKNNKKYRWLKIKGDDISIYNEEPSDNCTKSKETKIAEKIDLFLKGLNLPSQINTVVSVASIVLSWVAIPAISVIPAISLSGSAIFFIIKRISSTNLDVNRDKDLLADKLKEIKDKLAPSVAVMISEKITNMYVNHVEHQISYGKKTNDYSFMKRAALVTLGAIVLLKESIIKK
ncbi:hypothetical protein [Heliophilum fasciatum]|uniref:Uncharacterized protein n=1 Tax=Heliophilum fasciatum TaxID=35700 RepID=A0A4R2RM16_9FIRM|nr:hypothetical protein [Heliophilum fasciatum]MCW2277655.1 hypothetical protein [Heliophilum fasciatum]TCP65002.1 hypothetical protein EDD73_10774 [Heliophilum fasciatum]